MKDTADRPAGSERSQTSYEFIRTTARFSRLQMRSTWTLFSKNQFMTLDIVSRYMSGEGAPFNDADAACGGADATSEKDADEGRRCDPCPPLLTHTAHPEGISVSQIAAFMHASMPATSRLLGNLEKQGLIDRTPDPNDRRNTLVTLTAAGEDAHAEAKGLLAEYVGIVIDDLGEERTRAFLSELEDVTTSMLRALDTMRERYPDIKDVAPPRPPTAIPEECGHRSRNFGRDARPSYHSHVGSEGESCAPGSSEKVGE